MKTIFLSFTPEPFYEPIKKGVKRYEYRSRFCNEECYAYLYLSAPVQKVVARIKFGKRIELESWEKEFTDFRPPRSYYILDNNPLLLEYLDSMQSLGNKLVNDLACIEAAEVCTY